MKPFLSVLFVLAVLFSVTFSAMAEEETSAASMICMEAGTRTVLFEKDADTRRPMASTTKIMTALIVLENAALTDVFTVSESAAAVTGSRMGLLPEDRVSVWDLLHMLMLESANDAAETLAENVAGSCSAFVELMNERAKEMGLTDTHFANPHGLPDDNHYTTARELAVLTAEAMRNRMFRQLVSTKTIRLDYHGLVLSNSNRLLRRRPDVTGVKTGFTKKAGRCLVSSAERDRIRILCVTLNDGNDWNDHISVQDRAFSRVSSYPAAKAGTLKVSIPLLGSDVSSICAFAAEDLIGAAVDGKEPDYTVCFLTPPACHAPVRAGDPAGTAVLFFNGRIAAEVPLFYAQSVAVSDKKEHAFARFRFCFSKLLQYLLP